MKVITQHFIGTTQEWETKNPLLYKAVWGFEKTNDGKVFAKLGDGESHWNDLKYFNAENIKGLPEELQEMQENIEEQAVAWQQADTRLQEAIGAEAHDRQQADTRLQEAIEQAVSEIGDGELPPGATPHNPIVIGELFNDPETEPGFYRLIEGVVGVDEIAGGSLMVTQSNILNRDFILTGGNENNETVLYKRSTKEGNKGNYSWVNNWTPVGGSSEFPRGIKDTIDPVLDDPNLESENINVVPVYNRHDPRKWNYKPFTGIPLSTTPHLWVDDGSEIDLGDGTFGRRWAGGITDTAGVLNNKTLYTIVEPININSCGGNWYNGRSTYIIGHYYNTSEYSGVQIQVAPGSLDAFLFLTTMTARARNNAPYDVWIRYTKE